MRRGLLLLPLVLAGCSTHVTSSFVSASYRPSDTVPPALPSCAAPVALAVTDARADTTNVGRRYSERHPSESHPIKMYGKPAAFVEQGLSRAFQRAGHTTGTAGAPQLAVGISQFSVEEKVLHNAEYDGFVLLELSLKTPGSEQACWTGRVRGVSENYGRAASDENYQETLSRALDHAAAELFGQKDFGEALCGKCAAAPAASTPPSL